MKKITKTQKIILGSSLALLTLVPVVAVVATSCSNQKKNNNTNKTNKPTDQTQNNQNVVSTKVSQINDVINDIDKQTSLKAINELLSSNKILNLLSLTAKQAKLTGISNSGKSISFSVQLADKNAQFSQEILKSSIKNVIVSLSKITFTIPINPNMTNDGTFVKTTKNQVDNLVSFVNGLNSEQEIKAQLSAQKVLEELGLSSSQANVTIQKGAPINSNSKNYQSETIIIKLINKNLFSLNLSSSYANPNDGIDINNEGTVLTLTNVKTGIINNAKINVNLDLTNFANYLTKVEASFKVEQVNNALSNNSISSELKVNTGYLNVNLKLDESKTTSNGVKTYDLTIAPKPGCEFDNTKVQAWIQSVSKSNLYSVSYNAQTQLISISDLKTNIYNKNINLQNINSSLFGANSVVVLTQKIQDLNTKKQLVSTISKSVSTEKLSSDAILVDQAPMNSGNGLVLTFASKSNKEFETINVDLTPNSISGVFGNQTNTLKNQFSEISKIGKQTALITNSILKTDKISLENLGLVKDKNATISIDSLGESKPIQESFTQFLKTKDVYKDVQNEVLYTAMNDIESINNSWGQKASVSNTFITSSLKFGADSKANLSGNLIIQISNNTGKDQTVSPNNPLLNNNFEVNVPKNGYVLIAYDFDGSKLVPEGYNNGENWNLSYGFNNVKKTLLTSNDKDQKLNTTESSNVDLFGPSNLIDVSLNGISNKQNYFDPSTQSTFNKYLDSLTKESIQSQITTQDNQIWNFIKTSAKDVGDILTTLGNNPTLGQFLNSLSTPITDILSQITNNQGLGKMVGGILSNEPVLKYLTENSNAISDIVAQLTNYLKKNGLLSKLMPYLTPNLNSLFGNDSSVELQSNKLVLTATNTSSNIGNDFLKLLSDYSKTAHFKQLFVWVMQQVNDIQTSILSKQSLLEILGKDIQPILADIITETKATDNTNAAWIFLNSIYQMLTTIENSQNVKDIYDIKLFDILKKPEDTKAIIQFLTDGLKPFLQMVSPSSVTSLTKAIDIMTKVFDLIPTLHLQTPELIFKSLAQIQVQNGSKTQTITWQQLFDNYITFTPTVKVSSYDNKTHQITYTNELSFTFKDNVSLNLKDIKTQLSDLTVGVVTKALGVDLNKKIPGLVTAVLPVKKIEAIKLTDLLPDSLTISKGDGAKFALLNNGGYLIPTVSNGHVTWYTNNNMVLNTNFKSTTDKVIGQVLDNVKGVISKLLGSFLGGIASATIIPGLKEPIESFVNGYANSSFNFNGGWVNQVGLDKNPEIKGFSNNVQDLNYKLLHNDKYDKDALRKVLQDSKYSKDISQEISDMNGKYVYLNDQELNDAVLKKLFENSSLSWIANKDLPSYLKPVVSVQYSTDKSLTLFGNSLVNVKGQYVVQVKLPFRVLVSNNNGKTWYFTNNLQYSIPYDAPKK